MMADSYSILLQKLDAFTRKYYLNKLLRGLLLFTALIIAIYLVISFGEYKFFFSTVIRKILLYSFAFMACITGVLWIIVPILHYFKLGNILSKQQAAQIIGVHFSPVKDKLLNILELKSIYNDFAKNELVEASIQQKIDQIKLIPFSQAIDLSHNKKWLKYVIPPILLLSVVALIAPNILQESNYRLVNPNVKFKKKAPFDFFVDLPAKKSIQYQDVVVSAYTKGAIIPADLYLIYENNEYKLSKNSTEKFEYTFINAQKDINFQLRSGEYYSEEYIIPIHKKPLVTNFVLHAKFPAYTGKNEISLHNTGDLTVPVGTILSWKFNTSHADNMQMYIQGLPTPLTSAENGVFVTSHKVISNFRYSLLVGNRDVVSTDSLTFNVAAIEDQYPAISVEQFGDSAITRYKYFIGNISDDYGFNRLEFHYRIIGDKGKIREAKKVNINYKKATTVSDFSYNIDIKNYNLQPGDKLDYYFEVWDNDAVKGSKSTRSVTFTYQKPTLEQIEDVNEKNGEEIKEDLEVSQKAVKNLSQEIKDLKNKLAAKKNLAWEDKMQIEQLMNKHQELTRNLEDIKDKMQENQSNEEEYKKQQEEILDKQEKLQQMMDELLSDEMKDLMKQLEEMLQKMEQNNAFERLENMEMSNQNINKELDKMLELYKQLEFEQKVKDNIEKLDKLAQQQEDAAKKSQDDKNQSPQLKEQQDKLNDTFDKIADDLKKMDQLNKELNSPMDLSDMQEEMDEISEEMDKSSDELNNNDKNKASQSQKSASGKMKKMSKKLSDKFSDMQSDQLAEDIDAIRRLLENLIRLSMEEEALFTQVKKTSTDNPKYLTLIQEQYKLKDDARLIDDSLTALGKRQFEIQSIITDELYKMRRDLDKSIQQLEGRQKNSALISQQYVMTSANNLALLLSESMDNMQQQQNSGSPGSGSCKKPGGKGGSKPSPSMLKQLQNQMGEDLKKMGEKLKNGEDPKKMGKDFAQMAERQAALREALRRMRDEMSQQQKDATGINDLMDKMDKNETDLVNRKVNTETLKRQKEIETRMLEFEKAMREQGEEEQRKSNTAQDIPHALPPQLQEYLDKKDSQEDFYKTLPPHLKPFYKNIVEKYYRLSQ